LASRSPIVNEEAVVAVFTVKVLFGVRRRRFRIPPPSRGSSRISTMVRDGSDTRTRF